MGLAWFTFDGLFNRFDTLVRRFACNPSRSRGGMPAPRGSRPAALHMQAGRAHVAWAPASRSATVRQPLRVLRVVDACHTPCSAGRMVISGRMSDVCAELDRLVALEAARP